MNRKRIDSDVTARSSVVSLVECAPQVSAETVSLLEQLLDEARAGTVTGLAIAVLRIQGSYDLKMRGSASASGHEMGVAGMLAALQKMVLELAD